MRERGEVAASADAAAAGHHRHEAEAIEIEQAAEGRQRHAGIAEAQAVDLEPQHDAGDLGRHRFADADRVAQEQVPLELVKLVVGHALVGQRAEAGIDAVVGFAIGDRGLEPRRGSPRPGRNRSGSRWRSPQDRHRGRGW